MERLFILLSVAIVTLTSMSCADDLVAGDYVATRFVFSGAESGDFLADGGSIRITLVDGNTSGTMIAPASQSESGSEESFDLSGTYTVDGTTVTFDHVEDTFIRDAILTFAGGALSTMVTFSGTTLDVVLTRTQ